MGMTGEHIIIILIILAATWVSVNLVGIIEDFADNYTYKNKNMRGMRLKLKLKFYAGLFAAVIICGALGVILTFLKLG